MTNLGRQVIRGMAPLTHCHTMPHFDALKIYSCGNIVRKGEIACNKQFLLFSQCFLPYMVLIFHFKCTLKCRLQFVLLWTSLKFCHLYKINTVTQFLNISAGGLSQEKKRKFIYFVDARRMPLLYIGCDVIVKYTMFDPALIKLTLIDSGNL